MALQQNRSSLQFFCAFYSHLGLQLTANSFRTLLWNLTINCILLYCLYFDDPFRLIEHSFQPPAEKPLLVMFSRYNSHYKYPLTYTLTIVYYHLFGRRIRKLLFEFEQQQQKSSSKLVTRSYKTSLVPFLAIFALLHLLFLVGYSIVISLYLNHSQSPPAALIALKWFTIYVNHFSTQFPLVAVHNILKSKSCTLERIHCSLQSPEPSQISTTVELIKSCAQINEELCKLIAFPFLVFLFSNSLDSIGAICAAKVHLNLSILFYQSAVFGFLLHLARLEESSRANFRRIALVCRQPDVTLVPASGLVKLRESASVYEHQLHLHLFHLFTMEFSFTFSLALLILNYSVLVLQTSS